MSFFNVDLSKIEERLFAGIASNAPGERFPNKLWGFVSELPKKHPFRFAMLYSAGPATAERMTRAGTSQAERRMHLEAEIQCFENWQRVVSLLEKYKDQIAANDGTPLCDSITDIVDE